MNVATRLRLAALAGALVVATATTGLTVTLARAESPLLVEARKSYQAGRHEQAAKAATDALAAGLAPAETARAYYLRALALSASDKHAQAIADFTSAIWLGQLTPEERADAESRRAAAYGAVGVGASRSPTTTAGATSAPAPARSSSASNGGTAPATVAAVASPSAGSVAESRQAGAPGTGGVAAPGAASVAATAASGGGWSLDSPQAAPSAARPARTAAVRPASAGAGSALDERGWASSTASRFPASGSAASAPSAAAASSVPLIAAAPAPGASPSATAVAQARTGAAAQVPAAPVVGTAGPVVSQGAPVAGASTAPSGAEVATAQRPASTTTASGGWSTTPAASNGGLGSFLSDGLAALFGGGQAASGPSQQSASAAGAGTDVSAGAASGAFSRDDAGPLDLRGRRVRTASAGDSGRPPATAWQVDLDQGTTAPSVAAPSAAAAPATARGAARPAAPAAPTAFETMVLAALAPEDGNSSAASGTPSASPFGARGETGIIGTVQPGPQRTRRPAVVSNPSGTATPTVPLAPSIFSAGSGAPAATPTVVGAAPGSRPAGTGSTWTAQTVSAPASGGASVPSSQGPATAPATPAEPRAPQATAPQGTVLAMLTNLFTPSSAAPTAGAPASGSPAPARGRASPWGEEREGGSMLSAPSAASNGQRRNASSSDGAWSGSVATVAPPAGEPVAAVSPARPAVVAPPPPTQYASLAPAGAPTRQRVPTAQAKPAPRSGAFSLQVAALRSESEARELAARLMVKHQEVIGSYEASIEETLLGNMGTFFRVRVGPFASEQESLSVCQKLRRSQIDCFLVR
ncbi:MAG: hypothetical protein GC150_15500 [Rhizobiales bacterium]|nr:hypothetical protein [Hyphomicrobiales bacterium]